MKKYLNQLLLIAALIIVGCGDACKDVDCGPGTCDEGTCICPDGYEGSSCETQEIAIYFDLFNVTEGSCDIGNFINLESVGIKAKADGGPFEVEVTLIGTASEINMMEGTIIDGKLDAMGFYSGITSTLKGDFSDESSFIGVLDVQDLTVCNLTMIK